MEIKAHNAVFDRTTTVRIDRIEDIASLPWQGNYASDCHLFDACDQFIQTAGLSDADATRAERFVAWFGMGMGADPRGLVR